MPAKLRLSTRQRSQLVLWACEEVWRQGVPWLRGWKVAYELCFCLSLLLCVALQGEDCHPGMSDKVSRVVTALLRGACRPKCW
jgi:hypothetical protein